MAIFAKKKDGRGGDHHRNSERPAVTALSVAASEEETVKEPEKEKTAGPVAMGEGPAAEPAAAVTATVASAPELAETQAAGATARAAGGEGDAIEPVDIEPEEVVAPAPAFGIEDAIRLMRSLPTDPNIDLVVRVVRVTLSAVNVSVEDIMQDAERKEKKVRESIATLENDVADLEKQLHDKRAAISAHQADLRETATVRERLHMADKYTPHPPPPPPNAARVVLPKPREWERFDSDTPFKDS